MCLRLLLSTLLVYRSNFQVLHWNAKGKRFDRIHNQAEEYYDKLGDDIDKVAEMAMRLNLTCVNYPEAFEMLKATENKEYVILASDIKYGFEDFTKFTDLMFKDITTTIEQILITEEMQVSTNVGIKATLESIYEEYDLQLRYINARRMEE